MAISEPAQLDRCRRILAIPVKRHERRPIAYLTRAEIDAVLAAPDVSTTQTGLEDLIKYLFFDVEAGEHVSEITVKLASPLFWRLVSKTIPIDEG